MDLLGVPTCACVAQPPWITAGELRRAPPTVFLVGSDTEPPVLTCTVFNDLL